MNNEGIDYSKWDHLDDSGSTYVYRTFDKAQDVNGVIELIRQQLQAHQVDNLLDRSMVPPSSEMDMLYGYISGLEESCKESAGEIMVAVDDGTVVVGYAVVLAKVQSQSDPEDYKIAYNYNTYGDISDLAVHVEHQRRGIGSRLLQHCEDRVRAAGTQYLRTQVLAKKPGALHACHKFGFQNYLITLEKTLEPAPEEVHETRPQKSSVLSSLEEEVIYKPVTPHQRIIGWFLLNVLINLVLLNAAAELVDSIVIDRFGISIFVSVVLTLLLRLIQWLEHRIRHFFCVQRGRKIIGGFVMWLVIFSSKFLILWVDDYIFGPLVELGGFWEIIILSVVLMATDAGTHLLWAKIGDWDRAKL